MLRRSDSSRRATGLSGSFAARRSGASRRRVLRRCGAVQCGLRMAEDARGTYPTRDAENAVGTYPSPEFFKALHPKLENVVADKLSGELLPLGARAGGL